MYKQWLPCECGNATNINPPFPNLSCQFEDKIYTVKMLLILYIYINLRPMCSTSIDAQALQIEMMK